MQLLNSSLNADLNRRFFFSPPTDAENLYVRLHIGLYTNIDNQCGLPDIG